MSGSYEPEHKSVDFRRHDNCDPFYVIIADINVAVTTTLVLALSVNR